MVGTCGDFLDVVVLDGAVAGDDTADRPCSGVLSMVVGVGGVLDGVEGEYIDEMELRLDDMGIPIGLVSYGLERAQYIFSDMMYFLFVYGCCS